MWGEITYPFPNFDGATVEVCEWISNFIQHFTGRVIIHPFMLGLNLNHVSKMAPSKLIEIEINWIDGSLGASIGIHMHVPLLQTEIR